MTGYARGVISQITDTIYLSDKCYTADELHERGISKILSVGAQRPWPEGVSVMYIEIEDQENVNISEIFEKCFAFIDGDAKVLVHCSLGISRSPTIIIAYLMNRKGIGLIEAEKRVRDARSCIEPNAGFKKILLQYAMDMKII